MSSRDPSVYYNKSECFYSFTWIINNRFIGNSMLNISVASGQKIKNPNTKCYSANAHPRIISIQVQIKKQSSKPSNKSRKHFFLTCRDATPGTSAIMSQGEENRCKSTCMTFTIYFHHASSHMCLSLIHIKGLHKISEGEGADMSVCFISIMCSVQWQEDKTAVAIGTGLE